MDLLYTLYKRQVECTQCFQSMTIQCKNDESVQYLEIALHSVMLSTVKTTKYRVRPILCCLWNLQPDTSDITYQKSN